MKAILYFTLLFVIHSNLYPFEKQSENDCVLSNHDKNYMVEKIVHYMTNNTFRQFHTFDENGILIGVKFEYFENDQWVLNDSLYYIYDDDGNMLKKVFLYFDEEWIEYDITEYEYSSSGKIIKWSERYLDDEAWVNLNQTFYSYDNNDSLLIETSEYWNNGQWMIYYRMTQEFDEKGNRISIIYERTKNNIFNFDARHQFTFNDKGWRTSFTQDSWNNAWQPLIRGVYTMTETGKIAQMDVEKYTDGNWEDYYIYNVEYNQFDSWTKRTLDYWVAGERVPDYIFNYTYNEKNDLLSTVYQKSNNGIMQNSYQILSEFDEYSNLVGCEYNVWVAGQWIQKDYNGHIFVDAFGNKTTLYCYKYEVYYKNISSVVNNDELYGLKCYPNPANAALKVDFELNNEDYLSLSLFDCEGAEVQELMSNKFHNPGIHSIQSDINILPSGVYFLRILGRNRNEIRKVIIEK